MFTSTRTFNINILKTTHRESLDFFGNKPIYRLFTEKKLNHLDK
jgi:hypothetical protein